MERREKRKASRFLSHHLESIKGIGSSTQVELRRFVTYFLEYSGSNNTMIVTGSKAEGLDFESSDLDVMMSNNHVIVIQPNDEIPEGDVSKTVLVMDTNGCMPGYTLLRLHQVGVIYNKEVMDAMADFNGSKYLSSIVYSSNMLRPGHYLHGPCSTTTCHCRTGHEVDRAYCFHCLSWPDSLSNFRSRTIHCVWPSRKLVKYIVGKGCHFVAIGDKHSSLYAMQWRISFAKAEKSLVMSFNHVHLKTYALLKIFLKECLERDELIKDLLCSYFMKTIVFHAVEHSTSSMWVDENIVQCFWFCFTILLECVQTGYCPNYFVLTHNMFLSNVTGDNRSRLFSVLNKYQGMGWKCLFQCPCLQSLPQIIHESRSMYPLSNQRQLVKDEYSQDVYVRNNCRSYIYENSGVASYLSVLNTLSLKCCIDIHFDITLLLFIDYISRISRNIIADVIMTHDYTNKIVYKQIRRNTRILHLSAATDVCEGLLSLATFYYNAGCYNKASKVAIRVVSACQQRALIEIHGETAEYVEEMCGKGYTLLQKAKRSFVFEYIIDKKQNKLYPTELDLEVQANEDEIILPPLPYAVFLLVLSSYSLSDTNKARTIFDDLLAVRTNEVYGARNYPILHNLVGICHQLLGNTRQAILPYKESCRHCLDNQAAAIRIAVLRTFDTMDYLNVPCRCEIYELVDDDDDDMLHYHKVMYNSNPVDFVD